jgi:hypothetical protein
MEPAASIVQKLGGPAAVARICGVHRTRVSNWMRAREKGGTGGTIPHWHMAKLLAHAKENDIDLQPSEFVEHLLRRG